MFSQVWERVIKENYDSTTAILKGYDRKGIRGELYPVIIPATAQSMVQGKVYFNISGSDLKRLDDFEGEYYYRKTESVILLEEKVLPAEVYVLKEEYYPVISPLHWNEKDFQNTGLDRFIKEYLGFSDNSKVH
jgi:gamma-glutamylcyclotransferase (GGCT)/AIG2-like uncharacterized protein YtfP